MSNIRNNNIWLKITSEEKDRFDVLFEMLQTKCNISPKQQSQLFMTFFFTGAEDLLSSYSTDTQTKTQVTNVEEKATYFEQLFNDIKNSPFKLSVLSKIFFRSYKDNNFSQDIRTISRQFNIFLQSNNLRIIKLSNFNTTKLSNEDDYFVLHIHSELYSQLHNLTYKYNFNKQITSQTGSIQNWQTDMYKHLKIKSKTYTMDRVEYIILNKFTYEEGLTEMLPIDTSTDLIFNEVQELRNKHLYSEAEQLLQYEENQKLKGECQK